MKRSEHDIAKVGRGTVVCTCGARFVAKNTAGAHSMYRAHYRKERDK
jgi:hypothetical protein